MQRSDFRFFERLRVRWAEIDSQQIVFNGHYLTYFDTAVAGYWRALALPYARTMASLEGDLFMRKSSLDYRASARYDDVLDIGLRCARVGTSSILFTGMVFRQHEALVGGELTYVFADPQAQASRPVPAPLRAVFEAYEAGQPMLDVRSGDWQALGSAARAVREDVFIREQRIPAEMEWDEADAHAVHVVAFNRLGLPLATGRLLEHVPGVAKIGRMAVLAPARSSGVGRKVLDALLGSALARGERETVLHAQIAAVDFYERAGFVRRGPVFDEAGIDHVEMLRTL